MGVWHGFRKNRILAAAGLAMAMMTAQSFADAARIDAVWHEAKPRIEAYWNRIAGSGLPHSKENLKQLTSVFEKFVRRVKALPNARGEAEVMEEARLLYSELNELNEEFDHGLLETDERELLVPVIVGILVAAGVDPAKYDGEPGGEYRDF